MSIYYLIIYCLFSFFIAGILLLLLKWTITVSAQFEDSVSCRATLSSIGKIVHVDVLYQPQGSSITFHILRCLKFDNRSQTSYKVHDGIKSKSQKQGSGIQPGAALINPLVNLLKCIKNVHFLLYIGVQRRLRYSINGFLEMHMKSVV